MTRYRLNITPSKRIEEAFLHDFYSSGIKEEMDLDQAIDQALYLWTAVLSPNYSTRDKETGLLTVDIDNNIREAIRLRDQSFGDEVIKRLLNRK